MTNTYLNRLIAIREMLEKPDGETIQVAYDLLFDLWLENSNNIRFRDSLIEIAEKHQMLAQEFTNRLNNSFRSEEEKATLLKDIVLLYIPDALRRLQTEKTYGALSTRSIPKIFISYSHIDEIFKNELITMLAGLQRRNVLDIWQDRRIEVGDNWFNAIQKAMQECNISILFISPDFIASRFIQEEELSKLFQRRINKGLHVVPIIIRACLWQSEPVIKDLQALPKDGKPIISFAKENGDRDHIWMEIGKAIEDIASRYQ